MGIMDTLGVPGRIKQLLWYAASPSLRTNAANRLLLMQLFSSIVLNYQPRVYKNLYRVIETIL